MKISHDEKHIFCTSGPRINILQISTGKIVHSIEQVNDYSLLPGVLPLIPVLETEITLTLIRLGTGNLQFIDVHDYVGVHIYIFFVCLG